MVRPQGLAAVVAWAPAVSAQHPETFVVWRSMDPMIAANPAGTAPGDAFARAELVTRLQGIAHGERLRLQQELQSLRGEVVAALAATPAAVVRVPADRVADLLRIPGVLRVERAQPAPACLEAATAASHHDADHVHGALAQRGAGVVVAVVDTGIELLHLPTQLPHPAFLDASGQSRVVRAWSAFGTGLIDLTDRVGHGTNVAAIAVGRRWNGLPEVDDGFAPAASIASYRVTPDLSDVATTATLAQAYDQILIDRLAGLPIVAVNCSFKGSPDPLAVDQVALDRLARLGDVVVVVSAGNAEPGDPEPLPTVQSQAACNGLAIGGIDKNTRALSVFSAVGPLPGDGERTYPDLMAIGQDVHTARRGDATTFDTVSGTSFSVPMVVGSAALLRAARPDLDALTCKALLLQNVADLIAANPGRSRNHIGVGMLRTDLAVIAALAAQPNPAAPAAGGTFAAAGALATGTASTWTMPLNGGARYAVAAAWWRTDTASAVWPELDVVVRDAAGGEVASGIARRNLYERFVFVAPATGAYGIELRSVSGATAEFALVVGPDRSNGPANGAVTVLAPGCPGSGPRLDAQLVLPTGGGAFGAIRTNKPLADRPCTVLVGYDRASIPSARMIHALACRRAAHEAGTAAVTVTTRVTLGYSQNHPDALATSLPLAANFDPSAPQVTTTATMVLAATNGPATPAEFDFVLPLATPFLLDPALGHPLLQFEVLGNSSGSAALPIRFDAVPAPVGATGRVLLYAGSTTVLPANVRLVTAFVGATPAGAVPRHDHDGEPRIGGNWTLALRDAAPSALALLLQGLSASEWGGVPLPLALAPFGAPGCALAVAGEAALAVPLDGTGQASVGFAIPATPTLVGAVLFHQFVVFDAAANAAGLVVSDASRAVVGG
ncbi:MAG: S8/S53 family peptidase [Planctomycetes bacterium]|nr:S8/S53 family peptidase [Planctomycetota bacterium]